MVNTDNAPAPILTFRVTHFELTGGARPPGPEWTSTGPRKYTTTSLQAAAMFRRHSDEIAKKVFQRSFQEFYNSPPSPPPFLDPHQIEGVNWILSRKRSYLAHAPGAGKTAQAIIAACLSWRLGDQILFIVPPGLTQNWERECLKWGSPHLMSRISTVPLSPKQVTMDWDAWVIICPDSMLAKGWVYTNLWKRKRKFKFIAVDEASRFKEASSTRTVALFGGSSKKKAYPGLVKDARHVVLMDGSPMPNRPMELWAPLFALVPESIDCLDQTSFGFKYCGAKVNARGHWEFNHSTNELDLRARLRKNFMHVVNENELSHPERLRSMLFMDQDVRSPEQKTWERKHLDLIRPEELGDVASNQGEIATFRKELGVSKIPWIANYVRERMSGKNESILLFAWHREVCIGLAQELQKFNPGLVIGGTNPQDRERIFQEFQSGKRRLIIANIVSAGRGHNLQKADRIIFGEFSWSSELNRQCEKRASRRGRDEFDFVRCEYIVCPGSMDERVLQSIFTKEKRVERMFG